MGKLKLSGKELRAIGYPEGPVISLAMHLMEKNYKYVEKEEVMKILKNVLSAPVEYMGDAVLALIAEQLIPKEIRNDFTIRMNEAGIHFDVFGSGTNRTERHASDASGSETTGFCCRRFNA